MVENREKKIKKHVRNDGRKVKKKATKNYIRIGREDQPILCTWTSHDSIRPYADVTHLGTFGVRIWGRLRHCQRGVSK